MGRLDGRVAIVTGAGRGVGRAHALALATEGAAVVVNDLAPPGGAPSPAAAVVGEIVAAGGRAVANEDDVSSFDSASRLVDQALAEFGDLHILVNTAGILRDAMSFTMSEKEWDDVVTVDLKGHFAPTRFAAAYWRAQAKAGAAVTGRIVNTTSEAALFGNAGQSNYAAAKAGIAAMTVTLARELARYGVTVNALSPRARTALNPALSEAPGSGFDPWEPANVSPFVCWLASDDAAEVSGQVFIVGGGSVYLLHGWGVAGSIERDGRWTVEDLAKHRDELFGGRSCGVPAFSPPGYEAS